jgi:hypothetical protein
MTKGKREKAYDALRSEFDAFNAYVTSDVSISRRAKNR